MRTIISIIAILLISIPGFSQTSENQKEGMIKVSVVYPNGEDKTFDMEYYTTKHIPMVKKLLGEALKSATVEQGIAGGAPKSTAPYAAMGNMYFDTIEDFQKAFGPNAEKIMKDLPNFTNIEAVIQISRVMM